MKYRTLINFLILQSPRGIGQSTNLVNREKEEQEAVEEAINKYKEVNNDHR